MASNKGLGKGLGALLGESAMQPVNQQSPLLLPLQKIEPNRLQPRRNFDEEELSALADSIRQHGVIQPLTVRLLDSGYYQIIAGERRWRAARLAGLREVPVVVIEADDKKAMELALIENLQRADLTPIEEARGYQQLIGEYGLTQEQVADRVSKSRPAVANAMRLLSLPDELLALVEEGKLTAGHARAILSLKEKPQQLAVAQKVINLQLSVRQTEATAAVLHPGSQKKPARLPAPAHDTGPARESRRARTRAGSARTPQKAAARADTPPRFHTPRRAAAPGSTSTASEARLLTVPAMQAEASVSYGFLPTGSGEAAPFCAYFTTQTAPVQDGSCRFAGTFSCCN